MSNLPIIGKTYRDSLTGATGVCVAYTQYRTHTQAHLISSPDGMHIMQHLIEDWRLIEVGADSIVSPLRPVPHQRPAQGQHQRPAVVKDAESDASSKTEAPTTPTSESVTPAPADEAPAPVQQATEAPEAHAKRKRGRPRKNPAPEAVTPAPESVSPAPVAEAPVTTEPVEEAPQVSEETLFDVAPSPAPMELPQVIDAARKMLAEHGDNREPMLRALSTFGVNALHLLPAEKRAEFLEAAKKEYAA